MKKIIGFTLLAILSTSAYSFGLSDAVNATEKASEAAEVVDGTGLVKGSGKVVKGTKTAADVTKTAADTMGVDEKKEDGKEGEKTDTPPTDAKTPAATDAVTKEKTVEVPATIK
ncbi:MAG: hypothetical protein KAG06_08515 [Methylococcales bacterium]|nr:hypothetical protein [Methylococcales bacterium]